MISSATDWSARHRRSIMLVAAGAAVAGFLARRALPRDSIPDIADPQIEVVADWMGRSASDVAEQVTPVLTRAIGRPRSAEAVHGTSMSGMAFVRVAFSDSAALPDGRAEILRRVADARALLPPDVSVRVGPAASATGWVLQYAVFDCYHRLTPAQTRRLQDDVLRPALAAIPGVAEIGSVGGEVDAPVVEIDSARARATGIAVGDVVAAVTAAAKAGPDWRRLGDVALPGGTAAAPSVRVRDVAAVRLEARMSEGVAELDGVRRVAGGIVIANRGVDVVALVARVRATLATAQSKMRPGIQVQVIYDRSQLIRRVESALTRGVLEEIAVIGVVIVLFLGGLRGVGPPVAILLLVTLLTFAGLWIFRIPVTVVSLAGIGIALGLAVDAEVVLLEAGFRELAGAAGDAVNRLRRVRSVTRALAPPILLSLVIAGIPFLPVLVIPGETGRLLRPMAVSKTLVIAAAALLSLTLGPVLREWFLGGRVRTAGFLTARFERIYRPTVELALARPGLSLTFVALAVLSVVPILPRMRLEFLPRMDEGDLLFMPTTLPGVPIMEAAMQMGHQDRMIKARPEVVSVFGKLGRADSATDPAPLWMIETTVQLKPRSEWPKIGRERWYSRWAPRGLKRALRLVWPEETAPTQAELIETLDHGTQLAGWTNAWTAPARGRIDMLSTGARTPLAVRVSASDPERLLLLARVVRSILARLPETRSAVFESFGGATETAFAVDPSASRSHGVNPTEAADVASVLLSGGAVGFATVDGHERVVRVGTSAAQAMPAGQWIRDVTIGAPFEGGHRAVPLGIVGRPQAIASPSVLRSEAGRLVADVYLDPVSGVDLSTYADRARRAVSDARADGTLTFSQDESLSFTGQSELTSASQRWFSIVLPVVVALTFGLLFWLFRSWVEAAIVLVSVPFTMVGSIWTLFLLGYPLSAPVWAGLLSTFGLGLQTAVLMVVYLDDAFFSRLRAGRVHDRADVVAAHLEGSVRRLRPKVMTVATMAAGLLPLASMDGPGSEVVRRVAASMLGGLASSAFLTLEFVPVLFTIWRVRQVRRARHLGLPLGAIVGPAPRWARSPDGAGPAA